MNTIGSQDYENYDIEKSHLSTNRVYEEYIIRRKWIEQWMSHQQFHYVTIIILLLSLYYVMKIIKYVRCHWILIPL